MKTYEQVQEAFVKALEGEKLATTELVDRICNEIKARATEQFGEGVYVKGRLNYDMQGVSFRFKRPSIAQRFEVFVSIPVDRPARGPEAGEVSSQKARSAAPAETTVKSSGSQDPGQAAPTRLEVLLQLAAGLAEDQLMDDGRPHVDAINAALPEGETPFTAKERDQLWSQRSTS
jgi:hypothetical protein